jgi:hypothetical protein
VLLLNFPCLSQHQPRLRTDLSGYVFEKDGTSPVKQATVYVKRLPGGEVLTSIGSDRKGRFEIFGIEKGIYVLGVKTTQGNFNAQKVLGIKALADDYAKIYIALSPFSGTGEGGQLPEVLPNPVGQVIVLAGNSAIVMGISKINDEPREAGPFRIRHTK